MLSVPSKCAPVDGRTRVGMGFQPVVCQNQYGHQTDGLLPSRILDLTAIPIYGMVSSPSTDAAEPPRITQLHATPVVIKCAPSHTRVTELCSDDLCSDEAWRAQMVIWEL
ncbi:hypothetical protein B0H10DRAFT_1955686 [Mycena sp. CBHHK59/15]|nr:hypothetical protein B0H10DRAFT_1955686 [Mycena sp. CBHHK59/15]